MLLEVEGLTKSFGGTPILRGVSLSIAEGDLVALLGPSGGGKTTLLRLIAGLDSADTGQIRLGGATIDHVPTHKRNVGLMFQDYALFPHLDVASNIAFGLRMRNLPRHEVAARTQAMLQLVGLAGYERRRVYALSGGERQRVALARSLAPRPRLLMLDEPLAALDRVLRQHLQAELRSILHNVGVTCLYVTHDQQEAFVLADQVALLHQGELVQIDPPERLYRHPATPWAARFLGLSNLIPGIIRSYEQVETPLGTFTCPHPTAPIGTPVTLLIYPDAAHPLPPATVGGPNQIRGRLIESRFYGATFRTRVQCGAYELSFALDTALGAAGQALLLQIAEGGVRCLANGA